MQKITTDYGLIYNTDGSLCTTVRPDQIPFPGVNSWAVEEETENLITPPIRATKGSAHGTPVIKWSESEGYEISGTTGSSGSMAFIVEGNRSPLDSDISTVTISLEEPKNINRWVIQLRDSNDQTIDGTNISFPGWSWNQYYQGYYRVYPTDSVTELTLTLPTTGVRKVAVGFRGSNEGDVTSCKKLQVEAKPFATSFVDGTRPNGRLVISVEDLKFDIANDDWVISYWKYPVATDKDTQNGFNTCSLGQYISGNSKGFIWWGKATSTNKYRLEFVLNDATSIYNISNNTFNPTDYFYHWHYEVVKKSGKVFSYYVDGVKQCELIIPADKELQTPFDVGLSLGAGSGSNPNNTLIAAPYYGYNSATWTDQYIQEMQNTKLPYVAKSKPLVI